MFFVGARLSWRACFLRVLVAFFLIMARAPAFIQSKLRNEARGGEGGGRRQDADVDSQVTPRYTIGCLSESSSCFDESSVLEWIAVLVEIDIVPTPGRGSRFATLQSLPRMKPRGASAEGLSRARVDRPGHAHPLSANRN